MYKHLRRIAALLAVLLAVSFCASAQEAEPEGMEPVDAASVDEVYEVTEIFPEPSEDAEAEAEEVGPVEPASEETELMLDLAAETPAPDGVDIPEPSPVPEEEVTDAPEMEVPEISPVPTEENTLEPTMVPTADASVEPTADASVEPTMEVTAEPTMEVTVEPTQETTATPIADEPAPTPAIQPAEASSQAPVAVTLGVGEKYTVPEIEGTEATSYSSANSRIATVSQTGVIKALKKGSTTVTATRGETSVRYDIKVLKAPKSLKLSYQSLTLGFDAAQGLGEQALLKPKLSAGSSSGISYSGYNPAVVSVSEDGVVTAVGVGSTKLTARTFNKKKATVKIKVQAAPTGLSLNLNTLRIAVKGKYQLKWKASGKTSIALRFSSDNPKCVSVNQKGLVKALSQGTALVTAKYFNGVEAVCAVTVLSATEKMTPAFTKIELGVGEKSPPILGDMDVSTAYGGTSFKSAKARIATVSAKGVIKARKQGATTVKLKGGSGSGASVKVKVKKAPSRVTLNETALTIGQYSGAQLRAKLPSGQAGSVTFTSSNEGVAQVDGAGYVTGVGLGSAAITARTYNGKTARCQVTVVDTVVEISMAAEVTINTSDLIDFPIEIKLSNGESYTGDIDVRIDPSDVAVYESGKLLGVKSGRSAVLTVTAGGVSKTCNITVERDNAKYATRVIAHRGGTKDTENTLEAFRNFSSTGADGVELDIRSTEDGVQVVIHNETFTANGVEFTVLKLSLEVLRALNPSVCTLDEALDVIAATGKEIYLNPKDTALGAECVQAIRERGLQSRTLYLCGNDLLLQEIYEADHSAVLGYALSASQDATGDSLVKKMKSLHISYIMLNKALCTQENVNYWHDKGYKVCAWTVNDSAMMQSVCNMGVDSILTDYPEQCAAVVKGE